MKLIWRVLYTAIIIYFSISFTLFIYYVTISSWFRVQEYKIKHYGPIIVTLLYISNENVIFSLPGIMFTIIRSTYTRLSLSA